MQVRKSLCTWRQIGMLVDLTNMACRPPRYTWVFSDFQHFRHQQGTSPRWQGLEQVLGLDGFLDDFVILWSLERVPASPHRQDGNSLVELSAHFPLLNQYFHPSWLFLWPARYSLEVSCLEAGPVKVPVPPVPSPTCTM